MKNDRPAALETPDAVELPAADDGVQNRAHVSAEALASANRQRVHVAKLQHLWDGKGRHGPFCPQGVWILHANGVADKSSAQTRNAIVGGGCTINGIRNRIGDQELQTDG